MQKENFPQEWEVTKLGEVCTDPQYGYTTKASEKGNVKFLRTTDISKNNVVWDTVPFCQENPENLDKFLLNDGDIVISRAGSVGISYLIKDPQKSVFASYLIRFKPLIGLHYFYLFLKSPDYWHQIFENTNGIAIPNVNANKLKNIRLPLPPIAEQTQIATLLDDLLARVQAIQTRLNKIPELLKQFRQSVLADAVSGRLTEKWREENSYSAQKELDDLIQKEKNYLQEKHKDNYEKIIKEKENLRQEKRSLTEKKLPKGWIYEPFFEFSLLNRGFDLPTSERINGGYPIISSAGVIGFHNEYKVKGETVTVGRSGSVGQVFYLNQDCWVLNTALYVKDFGISYPKYVFYKLKSMNLAQYAASTAVPTLNRNEFILEMLEIPPYEEQKAIVSIVENYLTLADTIETQTQQALEKVNLLTQSILAKAFRGELTEKWRAENQALISGENSAKALLAKIESELQAVKKRK